MSKEQREGTPYPSNGEETRVTFKNKNSPNLQCQKFVLRIICLVWCVCHPLTRWYRIELRLPFLLRPFPPPSRCATVRLLTLKIQYGLYIPYGIGSFSDIRSSFSVYVCVCVFLSIDAVHTELFETEKYTQNIMSIRLRLDVLRVLILSLVYGVKFEVSFLPLPLLPP